ncbi:hypothetical protein JB92DRAFT_2844770 [Gautieria morchelliformis]|nr:hypothetical protein JB92DRAFT_2844770 [Gautieria morchelliformis]
MRDRERERGGGRGLTREEETGREKEKRSSQLDRLSIRRMFTPHIVNASAASQGSPDPIIHRPAQPHNLRDQHCNLPPVTSLDRRGSTRRRGKFSNTYNATVSGTSIFRAMTSSGATTAVSAHTVSAAGEVTAFQLVKVQASQGSALVGLQDQQERNERKRSLSITGESGDGDTGRLPNMRGLRSSMRNSLDGGAEEGREHLPPPVNGERWERRTKNDLPS